jgi:cell division GTPase FtsZ
VKVALVGVGAAGGRIVDRMLEREAATKRSFCHGDVLVFDTTSETFGGYDYVPKDRQVLFGDTHDDVRGEGTGGDIDHGVSAARADGDEIRREIDEAEIGLVDAILLVAGLGGGTGGGAGAAILEDLQAMYEVPVYAIGVLPHEAKADERIHNAARALRSFVPTADNTILFDNNTWYTGDDPEDGDYGEVNRELAIRAVAVFAVGELEGSAVAETRLDSSDVMRTLATGGVSTIGYATAGVEKASGGLLAWLRSLLGEDDDDSRTEAAKVDSLVRRAVNSRLTLPCDVSSAHRSLVGLSGPPSVCSRKGFESARHWLGEETGTVEVLAGDEPNENASELTAIVLLSTVTEVPRIDELQRRATDG